MKVEQNISRLRYLLDLFKMSTGELLAIVNKKLKKPFSEQDIFNREINVSLLKRIDTVFNKGIHFYLDPKAPEQSKEASIFFRKASFNSDLNIAAKKIVNHFEDFKISLSALATLADISLERKLPVFSIRDDVRLAATTIRAALYPHFQSDLKDFLKALIARFAENNILVFEFVETHNRKERVNIDGFFLQPNVIVLKRQQRFFRREIFTIVHELGHYLLNEEEIESLDYQTLAQTNLSSIENWCNNFAFYFLIGDFLQEFEQLSTANAANDYHFETVERISKYTHLSRIALFTRLLFERKLSSKHYETIKKDLEARYLEKLEEEKRERELQPQDPDVRKQKGSVPKPINSPLLVSTIQAAFHEGIINEYDVCRQLNIKPEKLDKYIG